MSFTGNLVFGIGMSAAIPIGHTSVGVRFFGSFSISL